MKLLPAEQLAFMTARVQAQGSGGQLSTGTGFFFAFPHPERTDSSIPTLITNKHVIAGATTLTFHMTRADRSGEPVVGDFVRVEIDATSSAVLEHPDSGVDLCAVLVGPLLNQAIRQNQNFFYRSLAPEHIPSSAELADLVALEDVVMIGYPIGLWDSVNNMPVFRRGVAATHPSMDYEGRKEFLIDMACFPGSSGSPVLLYNTNGYTTRDGTRHLGATRIQLLGALYAGPQFDAEGELQLVPVPTAVKARAVSRIPINVGVVIKAERILELETAVRAALPSTTSTSDR